MFEACRVLPFIESPCLSLLRSSSCTARLLPLRQTTRLFRHAAYGIGWGWTRLNFCRIHKTLRVTPAMEAGISNHVWTIGELVNIMPVEEPKPRGPYKKKSKAVIF